LPVDGSGPASSNKDIQHIFYSFTLPEDLLLLSCEGF